MNKKKPDWKKFDASADRLKFYGTLASPAYNTSQRLARSCMTFLRSQFNSREEIIAADICSLDLLDRICHLRHDHATLESVLMIVDVFLGEKYLPTLIAELCAKFSDEDLLKLTLNSNANTIDYVKQTIEIDVLISLLEGRALFKEGKSIEEFSREMIGIFERIYPIKRNLLKAA